MNRLKILDISNNLGDTKSLITHPATTTHRVLEEKERLALGITENLIRISVGLEYRRFAIFPRYRPNFLVEYIHQGIKNT